MAAIKRPIGPDDLEFYYGGLVRRTAILMSGCSDTEWERASARVRSGWLDKAKLFVFRLVNDRVVAESLGRLADNLRERDNGNED